MNRQFILLTGSLITAIRKFDKERSLATLNDALQICNELESLATTSTQTQPRQQELFPQPRS